MIDGTPFLFTAK